MGGIRKRGKKNRIQAIFNYLSIKRFENTPYYCDTGKSDCKCRNCKAARAFVSEIDRKINESSFRYQDYFPKSATLKNWELRMSQVKYHLEHMLGNGTT